MVNFLILKFRNSELSMCVEKVFVKPFENHIDIMQETNVKERILIVKKNPNVVNNTLQESEYSDRNHMVNRRWNCVGFGFYWI